MTKGSCPSGENRGDIMQRLQACEDTPMGPLETWPAALKAAVRTVHGMTMPAAVLAGEDATVIGYSPAYAAMAAEDEDLLGKPFAALRLAAAPAVREACGAAMAEERGRALDLPPSQTRGEAAAAAGHYISFDPIRDENGASLGLLNLVMETADPGGAKRDEAAERLKESERRLRSLVEGIPQLVWRAREPGQWIWCSPQWRNHTGLSDRESAGEGWLRAVHPADRDKAREAWAKAAANESFRSDYRILHTDENRYRWFQTRATPVRDETGRIVEWFGTSTDIDDLRQLREHERRLLFELQHRVRNTLATVRSIARRTAEHSESVEDYAMHLEGRIDAFARVQSAVTRDPSGTLDLATLIADELDAAAAREGKGITLDGPETRLSSRAAELLGLAVHELVTNAIKNGVFSPLGGSLDVRWEIEEGERLRIEWKETLGRPAEHLHRRDGFGTVLLRRTLPYELKAQVQLDFAGEGLRCTIRIPLDQIERDDRQRTVYP